MRIAAKDWALTLAFGALCLQGSLAAAIAAPRARAGGADCAARIAEFERIIESDNKTGNVAASVYRRIVAELGPVKASCAAGQGAAANARLSAVKSRHGYR